MARRWGRDSWTMMSTFNISRKALLGPKDCQQERVMSKCPFLRAWSLETTNPEVVPMVEPTGMGEGEPSVAGRGLTIAAQATEGADPVQPPAKAP